MTALGLLLSAALAAPASAGSWGVYGFNFPAWQADQYASPETAASLARLAATGARWIAVTPTWYAAGMRDSRVRRGPQTPSDDSVRAVIRRARALGLGVALKPHVDLPGDVPRSLLHPADGRLWFSEYRAFITHYARLAAEEDCGLFVVGTELFLNSGLLDKGEWERIIREVRAVYPGRLTYAANWYDVARVPFWGSLDFIGVDGYYPVAGKTRAALRRGWTPYRLALGALSWTHGKPVLFTEVGLASQTGANLRPWDYREFGDLDLDVQADYLGAFLDEFQGREWFAGFLQWAWDANPGGASDKSMTVQGKPALRALEAAFRRANPPALGPALGASRARALSVPLPY